MGAGGGGGVAGTRREAAPPVRGAQASNGFAVCVLDGGPAWDRGPSRHIWRHGAALAAAGAAAAAFGDGQRRRGGDEQELGRQELA